MNHTIVRGDPLKEASEHLQMSPERLLEILGIDRSSFVSLPADLQHEALSMMIQVLPELGQAGEEKHAELQPSGVADAAVTGSMRGFGAQPAALTTGTKVRRQRMGGTIVEKFCWDRRCEPVSIALGVKTGVELREALPRDEELAELRSEVEPKIDNIMGGRSAALLEAVPSIFDPEAECVVCLNAEREDAPDCVLYQCGHQCVHFECASSLRRCPMCRATIAAVLKL
eukprot:TRINITY_DN12382_c0_g1_i1.p2 TRINITY_DN12382_c0_g1~~TRINITY_DN12382_c0_g1_i1.p2  ORF type:complete len:228 (+),score=60.79 TRINITY_DN12382_c0_g1_i1:392-1075(+)